MARRLDLDFLRKVAEIRDLQQMSARTTAMAAAVALQEKQDLLRDGRSKQATVEGKWQDFMTAPRLQMEVMPFWSAKLKREAAQVCAAMQSVETAQVTSRDKSVAWHAAQLRSDKARELLQLHLKVHLRHRDEVALQEMEDRHLQRWSRA
jgi:hypothetical protein